MIIKKAKDFKVGDKIEVGWRHDRPYITNVGDITDGYIWTEWSDNVKIEIDAEQEFEVLEDED